MKLTLEQLNVLLLAKAGLVRDLPQLIRQQQYVTRAIPIRHFNGDHAVIHNLRRRGLIDKDNDDRITPRGLEALRRESLG